MSTKFDFWAVLDIGRSPLAVVIRWLIVRELKLNESLRTLGFLGCLHAHANQLPNFLASTLRTLDFLVPVVLGERFDVQENSVTLLAFVLVSRHRKPPNMQPRERTVRPSAGLTHERLQERQVSYRQAPTGR